MVAVQFSVEICWLFKRYPSAKWRSGWPTVACVRVTSTLDRDELDDLSPPSTSLNRSFPTDLSSPLRPCLPCISTTAKFDVSSLPPSFRFRLPRFRSRWWRHQLLSVQDLLQSLVIVSWTLVWLCYFLVFHSTIVILSLQSSVSTVKYLFFYFTSVGILIPNQLLWVIEAFY